MNLHDFIFSGERRHRITRHLIFWLCWILFSSSVQLTGFRPNQEITLNSLVLGQLFRTANRLMPQLMFCYLTVYILVPRFISRRRYKQFFLSLLLSVLLLLIINYLWFYFGGNKLNAMVTSVPQWSPFITKFFSFYSNINFTGPIPACCLMLAIKYYKDWYKKQSEGETLIKENMQAELQLLKAQIHPHFLFNTLNNIYSFTLTGSPEAEGLVNKLSGMVDYITTEGEKSFVPVEKEIQLINDYIGLEKVRYGNRLDLQMEIKGDYKDKLIAPLLLIPFVENCFKHGASMMRGEQWIHLSIIVKDEQLHLDLANSKPPQLDNLPNRKGIGLANVRKRLELLYPGKHFLKIESVTDTFAVHLSVHLHYLALPGPAYKLIPKLQTA